MSEEYYDGILLIDAQDDPRISDEEAAALQPIQKAFMESYIANREKMPVEEIGRAHVVNSSHRD